MNSNVLSPDNAMVTQTDGVYGSNRVNYMMIVNALCSGDVSYGTGELKEQEHKKLNFDVAQKFPDDEFAAILRPTQTELAQVHGKPITFKYCQSAKAVEFILSSMSGVDPANIEAGIMKNMLKKYDYEAYMGVNGNQGLKNNTNLVTTAAVWANDFDGLVAAVRAAIGRVKAATDITGDQYDRLTMPHTESITDVLDRIEAGALQSNREIFGSLFPSLTLVELPKNLETGTDLFYIVLRDMLTFHHASYPALYGRKDGDYGLSSGSLFTYEAMGVEIEENGAAQLVTLGLATFANAKKK
jgi:hypothetical protein